MDLASEFERWRVSARPDGSWGLAWFLAAEFCERFYASHGLVPWVIDHDGLGYYGITINQLPCKINPSQSQTLGRFTSGGDIENWHQQSPGDPGAPLIRHCTGGASTSQLIAAAVGHLDLPPYPATSHLGCRHHRWGSSYVLCFKLAAWLAMRYEAGTLEIWNDPAHTRSLQLERDPQGSMHEHPGVFVFKSDRQTVCIAGDGRLLDGSEDNVWASYMKGESLGVLAQQIARRLAI